MCVCVYPLHVLRNTIVLSVGLQRRNGNGMWAIRKSPDAGVYVVNVSREFGVFDSLIRTTNARRRGFRLLVHPTYGAVKLSKINKETNLWQFRSTIAEKEERRKRGRERG